MNDNNVILLNKVGSGTFQPRKFSPLAKATEVIEKSVPCLTSITAFNIQDAATTYAIKLIYQPTIYLGGTSNDSDNWAQLNRYIRKFDYPLGKFQFPKKIYNDHAAQMGVSRLLNFTNIIRLAPDASVVLKRMIVHSFIYSTRDEQDNGIFIK